MSDAEWLLARHVAYLKPSHIPEAVADNACFRMTDTLACILAGLRSRECTRLAQTLASRGGAEESTAAGLATKVPVSSAAFLNAALAHWCEWDDLHDGAIIHASAAIWPVLLAVAEARELDGPEAMEEVIVAAVAAYDVAGRIGEVLTPISPNGWYSTSVACAAAAAAGAARLRGLPAEGILSSMGLAGTASALTRQPVLDRCSGKNALCAQTASVVTSSLELAAAGIAGARTFLTGDYGLARMLTCSAPSFGEALSDLGERFSVTEVSLKPYPCCRATHPSIDLALDARESIGADQIASIELSVCEPMYEVVGRPFEPGDNPRMAALFSIQYTVASALVHGRVDLDTFAPDAIASDTPVLELARRIDVKSYPIAHGTTMYEVPVTMALRLVDGRSEERSTVDVSGSPRKPVGQAAFERKLTACADGALDRVHAAQFRDRASSIRRIGLAPLMALLREASFWEPGQAYESAAAE